MSIIRAQVRLPWTTNLPEDVTVNTFHFLTTSTPFTQAELDDIEDNLISFWTFSSGVAGDQLDGFLSNLVSRVALAASITMYDMSQAEPRVPIRETNFTLGPADVGSTLPPEVALCLSFQAVQTPGIPQARRRGRVFLGPWNGNYVGATGRPNTAVLNAIAAAGNYLLDNLIATSPVRWAVYSPTLGTAAEVTDGWCDDEWDTVRSRGRLATTRVTFT